VNDRSPRTATYRVASASAACALLLTLLLSTAAFVAPGVAGAASPPAPSATLSTVTASPTAVVAGGTGSTVTVTVNDSTGAAIAGATVSLAPSAASHATVTAVSATTGSNGKAAFTVTDATPEVVLFTAIATDASGTVTISQTATVGFYRPGEESDSTVTSSVDSVPADGTSTATVTVTLVDNAGPVAGAPVALSGGSITATPVGTDITNSSGVAVFTVTDSVAEEVAITATDTQDGAVVAQTAAVAFSPPGEAVDSTVSASVAQVPADGTTAATVTVTLRGASGPVAGHLVQLVQGPGSTSTITAVSATTGTTGVATFTVTATYPQGVTYVATDATDHVTLGETAEVTFLAGALDQATSTVTANPPTVVADGVTSSTVIVQLEDAHSDPIAGKVVTLAQSGSAVISPASATTTTAGTASFTVTDTKVQTVTFTATDVTEADTVLTSTASVQFTAGSPSSSTSTAVAANPDDRADGTSQDVVTVTVEDAHGNPVSGLALSLLPQSGHSVVSPASTGSETTNASGVATFAVTDTHVETVSYLAVSSGTPLSVSGATVAFVPGPPSATASTLTVSPASVPAGGTASATVTATVVDAEGNPIPSASVALTAGSGSSVVTTSPATTDAAGVAVFTVSDTAAESVTYTAGVTAQVTNPNGSTTAATATLSSTVTVAFTGPAVDATSSVTASPTSVPADGSSTSLITVTLRDTNGNPVSGQTVKLQPSNGSSLVTGNQAGGVSGPSGPDGEVTFTVSDLSVEQVTYTAVDQTDSVTLFTHKVTVTFTGQPSTSMSTISANPTTVVADGTTSTTITVTLEDANGNPVSGKPVFVQGLTGEGQPASAVVTATQPTTGSNGEAIFTATDTTPETVYFQATDTTDAIVLSATAKVVFTNLPTEASTSSVVASPSVVPADGVTASTVTVTLNDASGTPISGDIVSLAGDAGTHATVTPATGVSDGSGVVTFSVTDLHPETVVFTATDTTTSSQLLQTASVTFTPSPSEAANSTVTASPTTVAADGTSQTTVTVTLISANGSPIVGHTVSLVGPHATISPASVTSGAGGVAVFTATDTTPETVTFTATDTTDGQPVNATASVTFIPPPTEASVSTVVATPPAVPDNGTPATVVVTLLDPQGAPIAGHVVELGTTTTSGAVISPSPAEVTTGTSGHAVFTVTDTTVESVTFTAEDLTDTTGIDATATVAFQKVSDEAATSTVTASPSTVPADGTTTTTVSVQLLDLGQPLAGHQVVLYQGGGTSARITSPVATSNADGEVTFTATDLYAQAVTFVAYDQTTSTQLLATPTVSFTGSGQEQYVSTVTATPTVVADDGTSPSQVTVVLLHDGAAVSGDQVSLTAQLGSHALVTPAVATSDASGRATFTVRDASPEHVTLTATDLTTGLVLQQTAALDFVVPVPSVTGVSPDSGPSVGGTRVTVTGTGFEPGDTVFFGPGLQATVTTTTTTSIDVVSPAQPVGAPLGTVDVSVDGPGGSSPVDAADHFTYTRSGPPPATDCSKTLPSGTVVGMATTSDGLGYWVVDAAGDVAAFGDATCYGAMTGTPLNRPIVGIASDPVTGGYWLVASDGGVFAFDAPFFGSTGSIHLNQPIVAISASPNGLGYRFVAADGGVFSFGDAPFLGSMGGHPLNKPIVGMATTPSDQGYWLVASDGGVFSFGNAPFYGSLGSLVLNKPVVGMAPDLATGGYWLVAADGGVFSFAAPFFGSTGSIHLNRPIVGMTASVSGSGYRFVASDGGIFDFGSAAFFGSAVGP